MCILGINEYELHSDSVKQLLTKFRNYLGELWYSFLFGDLFKIGY